MFPCLSTLENSREEGIVRRANRNITYVIKLLDEKYEPNILSLHKEIFASLRRPEFFRHPEPGLVHSCLSETGLSSGLFIDGRLIGCRLTLAPGNQSNNHGIDLGFTHNKLALVAQFEGIIVLPEFQGLGLGRTLIEHNISMIRQTHLQYILATCHPDNHRIIKLLQSKGFVIVKTLEKYNGLLRHVLCNDKNPNLTVKKRVQ